MRSVSAVFMLVGCLAFGQDSADRVSVPFSDANRPRKLKAQVLTGSITVRGYDGKEVVVEGSGRAESRRRDRTPARAEGLRRLEVNSSGMVVEEQDNVVRVSTSAMHRPIDLTIQVPRATSIELRSTNDGKIIVENVDGEIDVHNLNGPVVLTNVSGVVVAHSLNGDVNVVMDRVTPDKPMSFSTLNGDIDVTMPADLKARLKLKSDNGDVYSDFDVNLDTTSKSVVEDNRSTKGKYRVRVEKGIYGTVNGGGADMQFTTLNGKIYIRKKK